MRDDVWYGKGRKAYERLKSEMYEMAGCKALDHRKQQGAKPWTTMKPQGLAYEPSECEMYKMTRGEPWTTMNEKARDK